MTPKPILNGKQVAAALGIDPKTLRKYVREGNCPVAPIAEMKPPKWRASDIAAFIAGQVD